MIKTDKVFHFDRLASGGTSSRLVWRCGIWEIHLWRPYVRPDRHNTVFNDPGLNLIVMAFYKRGKLWDSIGTLDMLDDEDEAYARLTLPRYVYRAATVLVRRVMRSWHYWDDVKEQNTVVASHVAFHEHDVNPEDSREAPQATRLWGSKLFGTPQRWVETFLPIS